MNTCRRPVVVRRRRAEPPASGAGVSASANCLLQVWALGCAALPCHVRPPVLTVAGAAGADQRRYGLDRCPCICGANFREESTGCGLAGGASDVDGVGASSPSAVRRARAARPVHNLHGAPANIST